MRQYPPRLVSVCIPSLNTAATIGEQLDALAAQTYDGPWEVVILDNGSTDGGDALAMTWADRLPALRVARVSERGISHVRNAARGAAGGAAGGDLLAFCDGDDVVVPGWLAALVRVAEHHDLVAGRADDRTLNPPDVVAWRGGMPQDAPPVALDHRPFAPGFAFAVWADVVDAVGGWDTDFVGGSEDVDFSWRALDRGYTLGFAADAVVAYRYRTDRRSLYRQFFRYGRTEALLLRRFAAVPRSTPRNVAGLWKTMLRRLPEARRPGIARVVYLRQVAYHAGHLYGSVRERTLLA